MVSLIPAPISSSFCILSSLVEVNWVTAISSGRLPSGLVSPSSAAFIISTVPAAWTLVMSMSRRERARMAFFTVLGMSWSLRSRKMGWPRRLICLTISGPSL